MAVAGKSKQTPEGNLKFYTLTNKRMPGFTLDFTSSTSTLTLSIQESPSQGENG
ncbi:MAG: hypothetical protein V2G33_07120 [bacterium JZ-2024 1]